MDKNKKLILSPYTSTTLPSPKNEGKFLESILSSKIKLLPRKIDKPIILYGAGNLGKMAKDFLDYLDIPFLYVVDENVSKYKNDKYWFRTKIINPSKVKEIDKKNCLLLICVVTIPIIDLRSRLMSDGWKDVAIFYDVSQYYHNKYPLNNGWFLKTLKDREKRIIKKVSLLLADNVSRIYYLRFLAWRRLRVELLFENKLITNNNRFFIPEILRILDKNEVFVDCGAYKGHVVEKFLKIVKNKYKMIYAIEPDNASFKILEKQFENNIRVKTISYALSNKDGKGKFYNGFDFTSQLNGNGKKIINTTKLDSLNIEATFIKIHLEGGELRALSGAIKTIIKYRPIIAVTLYHNSDGIWKIPIFLMNKTKNYSYYLRQHSWAGTGAVLYAIPKERQ